MAHKIDGLLESISCCLAQEKAYDVPSVCTKYGLSEGTEGEAFSSKRKYISSRLKKKDENFIVKLAKQLIEDYDDSCIGSSLNKYLDNTFYKLSEISRNEIIEELTNIENITGKISNCEFLEKCDLSFLANNYSELDFFNINKNLTEDEEIKEIIAGQSMRGLLDSQFFQFLEQVVHPANKSEGEVNSILSSINPILLKDGFELVVVKHITNRSVYKVVSREGVKGTIKNLIFASNGYKPEIVIKDALNNDIEIVKHKDTCLVFDNEIPSNGLKWVDLVKWWAVTNNTQRSQVVACELLDRLRSSLDSQPEIAFFNKYYEHYSKVLGRELPALIPQVYLHYDPYTVNKHGIKYLLRQRMDFLMLFSNSKRVVIEIDGKQHYSDGDISSPKLYSEMVRQDRELKFLNYDVYRIGGYELTYNTDKTILSFFNPLFDKYQIKHSMSK